MLPWLAALFLLNGCYTQLLTYSARAGAPAPRDSSVSDSSAGGYESAPYTYSCNCTPYEIQAGLCWCVCDRCSSFHRFGYQFCPRGFYSSYWGWDYYTDYPWWYDRYYNYR